MRSITFVQAFQFWLKLTALAVPVCALLLLVGDVQPALPPVEAFPPSAGPGDLEVYRTVSLMIRGAIAREDGVQLTRLKAWVEG